MMAEKAAQCCRPVGRLVDGQTARSFLAAVGVVGSLVVGGSALGALAVPALARAAETVTLHYYERPPYMTTAETGEVRGVTAKAAEAAFVKAGIPFAWAQTPAQRQLDTIRRNQGRDCAVGWFKTPERASFGLFTNPIYQDRPPVAIARRSLEVPPDSTLRALLMSGKPRVLMKIGLTYGAYIKTLIGKYGDHLTLVSVAPAQMVAMVAADRADLMFAAQEEADLLLEHNREAAKRLRVVAFSDVPSGDVRHILCSRTVGREVIDALNAVIPPR